MQTIPPKEESILGLVIYAPVAHPILFLVGFMVHLLVPVPLSSRGVFVPVGAVLLLLAPAVILWSQHTLRRFRSAAATGTLRFAEGPYRLTRNPTYLGLFLLTLGFAFLANSLTLTLAAVFSFIIVRAFIVPREERLMEKKYGDSYRTYRDTVGRWF